MTLNTAVAGQGGPQVNTQFLTSSWDNSVNAPQVWNSGNPLTGQGVGVAVIDSGVDGDLPDVPDVARPIRPRAWSPTRSSTREPPAPRTRTVTARWSPASSPATAWTCPPATRCTASFMGVAPNANIIAIKVGDDQGNASVLDVINGIQFAIDNQATYNIRVINLSLESVTAQSDQVDPLDAAVDAAVSDGIVVVAAAGNTGNVAGAVNYAPANDPNAIVVGAISDQQTQQALLQAQQQSDHAAEQALAQNDQAPSRHCSRQTRPRSRLRQQADQAKEQAKQQADQAAEKSLSGAARGRSAVDQPPSRRCSSAQRLQADRAAVQALQQSDHNDEQAKQAADQAAEQALTYPVIRSPAGPAAA